MVKQKLSYKRRSFDIQNIFHMNSGYSLWCWFPLLKLSSKLEVLGDLETVGTLYRFLIGYPMKQFSFTRSKVFQQDNKTFLLNLKEQHLEKKKTLYFVLTEMDSWFLLLNCSFTLQTKKNHRKTQTVLHRHGFFPFPCLTVVFYYTFYFCVVSELQKFYT